MNKTQIIRELIRRTRDDFDSYFAGTQIANRARFITELAILGDPDIVQYADELERMIPNTETDGSLACSYALNTGIMIESLLAFMETGQKEHYECAVEVFFDSVDFKVQEALEEAGIAHATERQISSHPLMVNERAWFSNLSE